MRMLTLTAALMIGTAAIAQTAPEPAAAPPADAMQTPPAPEATPPATPPAAPAPAPMAEPAPAPTEATAPAPMAAPAPAEAAAAAAPTAQANYPRCSKTVTDQCRQGSARESDTKGGPPKHRRR